MNTGVVSISSSRRSSWPRDQTHVSCTSWTAGRFFTTEPPGKPCLRRHIPPNIAKTDSKSICLCFSSRRFMTSGLTFKSLIHFEFSFCVCCKKVVQFYLLFLHIAVQFFQHNLLKRLKPMYILASFVVNNWPHEHGFISGLSFCSIYLYVYFCANVILFWLQLCNIVWNQGYLQLYFSFSRLLWLFRIFNFL